MFGGSEKVGKVQRFVGHSSQEEQKMVATLEQNCVRRHERRDRIWAGKRKSVGQNMTHKNKNEQTGLNGNS
jgi:hypothetical protein